jgi:hypothetical protein
MGLHHVERFSSNGGGCSVSRHLNNENILETPQHNNPKRRWRAGECTRKMRFKIDLIQNTTILREGGGQGNAQGRGDSKLT